MHFNPLYPSRSSSFPLRNKPGLAARASPEAVSVLLKFFALSVALYLGWHYLRHPLFSIQPYKFISQYYMLILGTPIKWGFIIFEKGVTSGFASNAIANQVIGALGVGIYISIIISCFVIIDRAFRRLGFPETIWSIALFGPAWVGIAWFIGTHIVKWANTH